MNRFMGTPVALFVIAVSTFLGGCSTLVVDDYEMFTSDDLSSAPVQAAAVSLGDLGMSDIVEARAYCDPQTYYVASNDRSFSGYLWEALESELRAAGLLSDTPSVLLNLAPQVIEYDARYLTWNLSVKLSASDGASELYSVSRKLALDWRGNFKTGGRANCNNGRDAFDSVVRELIANIMSSDSFVALIDPS